MSLKCQGGYEQVAWADAFRGNPIPGLIEKTLCEEKVKKKKKSSSLLLEFPDCSTSCFTVGA